MSNYDDYFTNDDKPFAENLNDALLLSNVFDMTVPIRLPLMFKDKQWLNTLSPRKAGVSIITLKEQLPSGVSVSTVDNNSVLTGTGTVQLKFYPNFNSFGKIKSIDWESTGTLSINLKTVTGSVIASNISKGTITNQLSGLMTLQEIVIEIVMASATLNSLEIVMENKSNDRYGAEVGISDVNGLQSELDEKIDIADIIDNLISTDINNPLSANQGKVLKELVDTKSSNGHTHDDRYYTKDANKNWIRVYTEPYSTPNSAVNQYSTIYINKALRLVDFRCYKQYHNFENTGEYRVDYVRAVYEEYSANTIIIAPKMPTPLASYNVSIAGAIDADGYVVAYTNSVGSKNINLRGMWHY